MTELIFLKDKEWSAIDGEVCRVKDFRPMATVADGRVIAQSQTAPYAAVDFECSGLPQDATGLITHRVDFLHLWNAFIERGVGEDEEVNFFWTLKHNKWWAWRRIVPRLIVWVCRKGAFELMVDRDFQPELTGLARHEAMYPLVEWKPESMH
jgi:hypothetical protein